MAVKLTKEAFAAHIKKHGVLLTGDYINARTKTTFTAACGHVWEALPRAISRGAGCPVCAKTSRRLDAKSINERLAPRGFSIVGEYKSANKKAVFRCESGHEWEAKPSNIFEGNGCPHCAYLESTSTTEEVNARLAPREIQLAGEYVSARTKATFTGACGHSWEALPRAVLLGTGCPHCATAESTLTAEEINARLAPRGISLAGEYVNAKTKAAFKAGCGHVWEALPRGVFLGRGCPHCAEYGGLSTENSFIYVLDYGNQFTKIGIATDPVRRVAQLQKATREEITLIALYQSGDATGRAAWEAEQAAHRHFAGRNAGQRGYDGATELFKITPAEACDYLRKAGCRVVETVEG